MLSRRSFLGGSLMAAAGCSCGKLELPRHRSDYAGVQIGTITYSYRSIAKAPFSTLKNVLGSQLGTIELMGNDLECDVGIPFAGKRGKELAKSEQQAQIAWRKAADFGKFREVRRRYNDAGVDVHIVKFGSIGGRVQDWETDYYFKAAEALGAKAITCEIPKAENDFAAFKARAEVLREYMKRYGIKVAFHNHLQINSTTYDGALLGWSDDFMINFDIGHYVAANEDSGVDFVKKYHDRIFSIHLKDRTTKAHGQKNLAFGTGDTPLKGLFELMQREGYDYPCDIELEYQIPKGSDAVREVGIANRYCRNLIV